MAETETRKATALVQIATLAALARNDEKEDFELPNNSPLFAFRSKKH
ncbi:hypothetical protein [uncultured Alistipes sp.]|nr:hypothetical protein [uncultured Alistipes sp.]